MTAPSGALATARSRRSATLAALAKWRAAPPATVRQVAKLGSAYRGSAPNRARAIVRRIRAGARHTLRREPLEKDVCDGCLANAYGVEQGCAPEPARPLRHARRFGGAIRVGMVRAGDHTHYARALQRSEEVLARARRQCRQRNRMIENGDLGQRVLRAA